MSNLPDEDSAPPPEAFADASGATLSQSGTTLEDDALHQVTAALLASPEDEGLLAQILAETKSLAEDFALKLKYDQSKDKTIDALTDELRRHRAGLHFTLIRPLLADLVSLYDDLMQLSEARAAVDPPGARTFADLGATVEELLARQGVSTLSLLHDIFESKQQRASRTTPTDQPELVGRVAAHLRQGFVYDDRVVRPELVAVYVLRQKAETPASTPPSE